MEQERQEEEEEVAPISPSDNNMTATNKLEQILLFGCGLGSSLCYIATLSSLVYFKFQYGPDSYVDLNLAIYLPLLPISLAQLQWDQYYDVFFQSSRRTFLFRGLFAFGLSLWGTIGMITTVSLASSMEQQQTDTKNSMALGWIIWHATLQGAGGAILYGTLNQLASFLGGDDNDDYHTTSREQERRQSKATISAGVQASALVVLVVNIASQFGSHTMESHYFVIFLWIIAAIEVICLAMFCYLLLERPSVRDSMIRRDSSLIQLNLDVGEDDEVVPENSDNDSDEDEESNQEEEMREPLLLYNSIQDDGVIIARASGEYSNWELLQYSKTCILVLLLTLIPSFMVGSWFAHVSTLWIRLPEILFYTRIASDFMGRLVTISILPPKSIKCLLWTAMFRLIPTFGFFIIASSSAPSFLNDMLCIGLVAVIAFLSGYLVTGVFQLAPQQLSSLSTNSNDSNNLATQQASLLTVAFSIAAISGLIASFTLLVIFDL